MQLPPARSLAPARFLALAILGLAAHAGVAQFTGVTAGPLSLNGLDGEVRCLRMLDDGSGPALYAGGAFKVAGGVIANGVARWDGEAWTALGGGVDGVVHVLAMHDEGGERFLYAGGLFTSAGGTPASNLARWNGSQWSPIGAGTNGLVRALASFDPGSGANALFAGGDFTVAGGVSAPGLAIMWNGLYSNLLGSVTQGTVSVRALASVNEPAGPRLFIGGLFTAFGGVYAAGGVRWTGTAILPATGSGAGPPLLSILKVLDVGSGPELYGNGVNTVLRWTGAAWTNLTGSPWVGLPGSVDDFTVTDLGTGPRIVAAYTPWMPTPTSTLEFWSGAAGWQPIVSGLAGTIRSVCGVGSSGPSGELFVGGSFSRILGTPALNVARRAGGVWNRAGGPVDFAVSSLAALDDESGPTLWAAGVTRENPGSPLPRLGFLRGGRWTDLSAGIDGEINCLRVWDDGTGPALYVGGGFQQVGGLSVNGIAKWTGRAWTTLGPGPLPIAPSWRVIVRAMTSFDDDQGPGLIVAGTLLSGPAGSPVSSGIARWNGASWSAIGNLAIPSCTILSLCGYDPGTGPLLIAGGLLAASCGAPGAVPGAGMVTLAWNGVTWQPHLQGLFSAPSALAVMNENGVSRLYVLSSALGTPGPMPQSLLSHAAGQWVPTGFHVPGVPVPEQPRALLATTVGDSPMLMVAGDFVRAGGIAAGGFALYDGQSWTVPGSGAARLGASVAALAVFDDGTGPAVYAGGSFSIFNGVAAASLARMPLDRPGLRVAQADSGGAVTLLNTNLVPGHEIFNLVTTDLVPPGLGNGRFFGLSNAQPSSILEQLALPATAAPFHFFAAAKSAIHGPWILPPLVIDAVSVDATPGLPLRSSPVGRFRIR